MTTLSLIIYLASVDFAGGGFILLLMLVMSVITSGVMNADSAITAKEALPIIFNKWWRLGVWSMITLFGLAIFQPDKETIITIAAIEYGEDIKALERIETLLDKYAPVE